MFIDLNTRNRPDEEGLALDAVERCRLDVGAFGLFFKRIGVNPLPSRKVGEVVVLSHDSSFNASLEAIDDFVRRVIDSIPAAIRLLNEKRKRISVELLVHEPLAFGIHRHLCRPNSATDRTVVAQARIDARKAHHATSNYGRTKLFRHNMAVARAARPRKGERRCVVGGVFRHKISVTGKAAGRDNRLLRIDAIGRFRILNVRADNASVLYNEVCHLAAQANVNAICGRNLC